MFFIKTRNLIFLITEGEETIMLNGEKKIARPLRWAMVGGGRLGQVGYKHRTGALRDNTAFQLVSQGLLILIRKRRCLQIV